MLDANPSKPANPLRAYDPLVNPAAAAGPAPVDAGPVNRSQELQECAAALIQATTCIADAETAALLVGDDAAALLSAAVNLPFLCAALDAGYAAITALARQDPLPAADTPGARRGRGVPGNGGAAPTTGDYGAG